MSDETIDPVAPVEVPTEVAPVADVPAAPQEEAKAVEPTAEELRDERVVPVAQGVLADLASEVSAADINKETDLTSIVIKVLKRGLAADLNLVTENPYVFSLVLGSYSALSTVVQKCRLTDTDDARFGKIGGEILSLLVNANVPMGAKVTKAQQEEAAEVVQPHLEEIFAREKLTWLEVKYIMEGLFRSLKSIEQVYMSNIELSVKRMEAKILGLEDMGDLSMSLLDATLQKDMSEVK